MTVGDIRSLYFVGVCIIHCPCLRCTYREGDKAIFRLKKDIYNTITFDNLPTSVMCKYNPAGRFSNVSDAAARRPIFSVGEEIIPLKKSLCILPEVIERNYPFLNNQRTQQINERGNQHSPPSKR